MREDGGAALSILTAPDFSARGVAVTENPIAGIPETVASPPAPPGRARIGAYEPERVVVDTQARRRSVLVLTDSWYPGWKVLVDGKEEPIHRVDYLIRGVAVPAGTHRVEFHYEPASWRAGWIISGVALVGIGAIAGIGWRRRRRRHAHDGAPPHMFDL